MNRTQEEFREQSVAALAHALVRRVPEQIDTLDDILIDHQVLVEPVPTNKPARYRERRRFRL